MDKEERRKTSVELALEDTMRELLDMANRGDTSEPKNIVVHEYLYRMLLHYKAMLMMKGNTPATFENAIIDVLNKNNGFTVLINKLIRKHPEIREALLELAKEEKDSPELYAQIDAMCKTIKA